MGLAKGAYSAVVGWSVLEMLFRSCWCMLLLVSFISLLIFCLVLAIVERIVLKYLTMIMYLFILSVPPGFVCVWCQ